MPMFNLRFLGKLLLIKCYHFHAGLRRTVNCWKRWEALTWWKRGEISSPLSLLQFRRNWQVAGGQEGLGASTLERDKSVPAPARQQPFGHSQVELGVNLLSLHQTSSHFNLPAYFNRPVHLPIGIKFITIPAPLFWNILKSEYPNSCTNEICCFLDTQVSLAPTHVSKLVGK